MYIKAELDFTWVCIERVSKAIDSFEDEEVHEEDSNGTLLQKVNGSSSFCKGPRTQRVRRL